MNERVSIIIPVEEHPADLAERTRCLRDLVDTRHEILLAASHAPGASEEIPGVIHIEAGKGAGFADLCRLALERIQPRNHVLLLDPAVDPASLQPGFVEEMLAVLVATEKHGAVAARLSEGADAQLAELMPRWSVLPVADGTCLLVGRMVLDRFGLLPESDEAARLGPALVAEFCVRMGLRGFSVLAANKVRIRLSGPAYAATQLQHQRLHKRHPILEGLVDGYRRHRIHPLEHFASVVDPSQGPVKVLISLYALPSAHNGTSEGALSLTEAFLRLKPAEWEVSIVVNPQADTYHYVSERFPNVHHPDTLQGLFHVAFVPSQIFHPEHLLLLTRHALRVGFQMLDIISLRCPQLLTANPDYHHVFGLSLMLLDGIGYNSDYTRRDVEAYFTESAFQPRTTSRVIHQAVSPMTSGDPEARLPFDDYLLVLGNVYAHKSLDECLAVARQVPERNFIILGIEVDGEPNVHGYASGHLADEFVAELYKRCTALLFPSQYEGFGLPLLQAVANGKPCILLNNEQNRELADTCLRDFRSMLTFFDSFAELPALLRAYNPPPAVNGRLRTWDDVARETMALVEDILAEPVDARRLERRWKLQGALDVLNARGGGSLYGMGTKQIAKLLLRRVFDRWPLAYRAANVLRGRSPSGGVHAQTEEIVLHHGRLVVGGWAFIPARRIASARLLLDGQTAGEEYTVVYGLERPDVGQAHGFRRAQRSGFRIEGPAPEKVREMRLELLSPRGRTVGSLRIAPAHERRGAFPQ